MATVRVAVKLVVHYGGHSVKANGGIDLKFDLDYSELTQTIQMQQMLNNYIVLRAKHTDESEPFQVGMFRLKKTEINSDGTSKLVFDGDVDSTETSNLNRLVNHKDVRYVVRAESDIEVEETAESGWD